MRWPRNEAWHHAKKAEGVVGLRSSAGDTDSHGTCLGIFTLCSRSKEASCTTRHNTAFVQTSVGGVMRETANIILTAPGARLGANNSADSLSTGVICLCI